VKPKLREEPREWLKFAGVLAVLLGVAGALLYRGRLLSGRALVAGAAVVVLALVVFMFRPRWCRGLYRGGMTVSFYIGQVVGRILLSLFFLLLLTPLGLLLRLLGKDLLALKRRPDEQTWWHPAKSNDNFDRQF